ncbi:hypothetical protein [Roseomonas sp. USHLN139]|uniref:hypothetical protein n=1 Tax=Roseomonas sp. USHLN139 TaxID=3081298 RepID=UPI003B01439D
MGLVILSLCTLQACGLPSAVTTPPAGEIIRIRNEQTGYAPGTSEATSPLNPTEMRDWGYAYIDRQCVDFFAALQRARSQGEFASSALAGATAAATAILALAEASTKATGVTAAALGFAAFTLNEFRRTALLTEYPDETQQLVREALTTYRSAAGTPSTGGQAASLVAGYAQICTLSGIRFLVREAIATARTRAETTTELTPMERLQFDSVGRDLGLSGLGPDAAAALLVFAEEPTSTARQQMVRQELGGQLSRVLRQQDGGLVPANSERWTRAIGVLRSIATISPAFRSRVNALTGSLATAGETGVAPAVGLGPLTRGRAESPLIPNVRVVR